MGVGGIDMSLVITIIYILLITCIGAFIVWNSFETKNIYEKIMGILMLTFILLRIFLIK